MKKCSMCKTIKPYSEFNKNKDKKDGYGSGCRECMRVYCKETYPKYKHTILASNRRRRKETREWFSVYKSSLICESCGYNKCHRALDFHHVDPTKKDRQVYKLVSEGYPKSRILTEIKKCEVLCSNCHREKHFMDHAQSGDCNGLLTR